MVDALATSKCYIGLPAGVSWYQHMRKLTATHLHHTSSSCIRVSASRHMSSMTNMSIITSTIFVTMDSVHPQSSE
eukprot:2697302-Pyramimonas_sp.AAC.1